LVTREMVAAAMHHRASRAMLLIDVSLPRNIERSAGEMENVFLHDMNDLRQIIDQNLSRRMAELPLVEQIVSKEVESFFHREAGIEVGPLIKDLRGRYEEIRDRELERALPRFREEDRNAVRYLASDLVRKLLEDPTEEIRETGRRADGGMEMLYGRGSSASSRDATRRRNERRRTVRLATRGAGSRCSRRSGSLGSSRNSTNLAIGIVTVRTPEIGTARRRSPASPSRGLHARDRGGSPAAARTQPSTAEGLPVRLPEGHRIGAVLESRPEDALARGGETLPRRRRVVGTSAAALQILPLRPDASSATSAETCRPGSGRSGFARTRASTAGGDRDATVLARAGPSVPGRSGSGTRSSLRSFLRPGPVIAVETRAEDEEIDKVLARSTIRRPRQSSRRRGNS
jgi:hypothetical protein